MPTTPPDSLSDEPNSIVASQGTFVPMVRLAFPVVCEQLLFMLVMLADMWLVGHFVAGDQAMQAIGSIAYALWLLTSLFEFVSIGSTAMVARFIGAGKPRDAQQVANQSLVIGAVLAVAVTLVAYALRWPFVIGMGLQGEAAELAVRYLDNVLPALPLIMVQRVGIACMRGAGNMVVVFYVMAVVNLTNIAVSYGLVDGLGWIEPMGWDGVAIGTAVAQVLGGLIVLGLLLGRKNGMQLRPSLLRPDVDMMRRILRIGIPGGIDMVLVIGCHLVFLRLINELGPASAAAHSVAVRLESMAFLPGVGFSVAATTLVGQFLGAGDEHRAGRSVLMACLVGSGTMMSVGVVFFFGGFYLSSLFVDADEVATAVQSAVLLKIAACAMLPLSLQMIISGALRGAGDTRWPLAITLLGMLGVRIPLAIFFSSPRFLDLGVEGAWYALLIDLVVRCLLLVYRFRHGGWKRITV